MINIFKTLGILALIVIVIGGLVAQYTHEESFTATVYNVTTQMNLTGDKDAFSTSYSYYVSTDKGILKIQPDGLMASKDFGRLENGKTYRFHTRGYSYPLLKVYPYVITAREKNEKEGF